MAQVDPDDLRGPVWVLHSAEASSQDIARGDGVLLRLPLGGLPPAPAEADEALETGAAETPTLAVQRHERWTFRADHLPTTALIWSRAGCSDPDPAPPPEPAPALVSGPAAPPPPPLPPPTRSHSPASRPPQPPLHHVNTRRPPPH